MLIIITIGNKHSLKLFAFADFAIYGVYLS